MLPSSTKTLELDNKQIMNKKVYDAIKVKLPNLTVGL